MPSDRAATNSASRTCAGCPSTGMLSRAYGTVPLWLRENLRDSSERELHEEDRFHPLDDRALAANGVRRLRLHRADDDEVEPQVPLGIEACPHLDALPVRDVFTTLDDRVCDAVSLASTVRVRDSLPLHDGVDTSRRPGPCELLR